MFGRRKPDYLETIVLPDGHGTVRIEGYGEHHMGCANIAIVTPFPISGIHRFFTTNGEAYYSSRTNSLLLRDSSVILKYGRQSKVIEHWTRPVPLYFGGVAEDDSGYRLKLYGGGEYFEQHVPFKDAEFKPGFGPVRAGSFPNAMFWN